MPPNEFTGSNLGISFQFSVNLQICKKKKHDENLQQLPDHFSPSSSLFSTIGYLEAKLLRFQILIWRIVGFCILLGSGDIRKNVKCLLSVNLRIWKNWKNYNENLQQLPDHFSPSSGLFSTMSYLENKLLRF